MVKIKRVRTADAVVAAFRFGKEEGTRRLADPRDVRRRRRPSHRGPHLGLQGEGEARADRPARALPHRRARLGRAEPLEVRRGACLGGAASGAGRGDRRSTTSPATASDTAQSSCAGAKTRIRTNAISRNCVPDHWSLLIARRTRRRPGGRELPGARPTTRSSGRRARRPRSTRSACATRTGSPSTARTGDLLIGDVGGSQREEIDWIGAAAARGANFGWACREGKVAGPAAARTVPRPVLSSRCSTTPHRAVPTRSPAGSSSATRRSPASSAATCTRTTTPATIRSLALNFADPDDRSTGLTVATALVVRRGRVGPALRDEQRRGRTGRAPDRRHHRRDAHARAADGSVRPARRHRHLPGDAVAAVRGGAEPARSGWS